MVKTETSRKIKIFSQKTLTKSTKYALAVGYKVYFCLCLQKSHTIQRQQDCSMLIKKKVNVFLTKKHLPVYLTHTNNDLLYELRMKQNVHRSSFKIIASILGCISL